MPFCEESIATLHQLDTLRRRYKPFVDTRRISFVENRVWFKKNLCPRCVLPKKTLSQMSCSEHFQKGNCPRCEVQKHPLSQMCASIKTAVPDVMLHHIWDIDVLVLVWNITSGTVFNLCFGMGGFARRDDA